MSSRGKKCCFVFHEMPAEDRKNKNSSVCMCVHLYVCGGGLFVFLMGCDSCWQEKNREGETSCCAGWTECEILHYRAKTLSTQVFTSFKKWRKTHEWGTAKKKKKKTVIKSRFCLNHHVNSWLITGRRRESTMKRWEEKSPHEQWLCIEMKC